VTLQFYDFTSR